MRLSEVPTGQEVVIVKVLGYGAFCKRIIEMGFVRGKKVKVLLNAPLKDPVKYKILDYEVSLRRSEAALIEVITTEEAENILPIETADVIVDEDIRMQEAADRSGKVINIALVGNPNCGKTSLFNIASGAHEHVGNYSGVTVMPSRGTSTTKDTDSISMIYREHIRYRPTRPRNCMCVAISSTSNPM